MVVTERHPLRITTSTTTPARAVADALVVAVPRPPELRGPAAEVDRALGGRLAQLIELGEIRGAKNQVTVVHADGTRIRAARVVAVGTGRDPGPDEIRGAVGAATRAALGAGLGLLLGERLSQDQRRAVGWTLFLLGALSTVPLAFEILGGRRLSVSARPDHMLTTE